MKIAIASQGNGIKGEVAGHFGTCPEFVLVEAKDGKTISAKTFPNPCFGKHMPGEVPKFMKEIGADIVIAGGIGPLAVKFLNEYQIKMVTGVKGKIEGIVSDYLEGKLKAMENDCSH